MSESVGVTAVVLAGGGSTRLGRDKSREVLGGMTLLERVLAAAEPVVDSCLVVGPRAPSGIATTMETPMAEGPLRAFAHAAATVATPHLLLLGCDHPLLSHELLGLLIRRREAADAVVAVGPGGVQPLLGVYATRLGDTAEGLLASGARSLKRLLDASDVLYIGDTEWRTFDPEGLSFLDVDDEADLERVRGLM